MRVLILGAGINGLTTGVLLSALGIPSTIVTHRRADRSSTAPDPFFASRYPAASVIPHAVRVDDVVAHMRETQAFFEVLRQHGTFGVRQQMHYELFESPVEDPPYAPTMHDFRRLPGDGSGRPSAPSRPGTDAVYGWRFRTYFAETPTYVRRLFDVYEAAGGRVETREPLTRGDLSDLPGAAVVNCLGAGSRDLFDDPSPHRFLEGRLVYAPVSRPAIDRQHREVCSYNYAPSAEVYAASDGSPAGLYVYPRSDVWVIGGTKQPVDPGEGATGASVTGPTYTVDGHAIPRPMVDVNAEILKGMYGIDIRETDLRATRGLRFARDLDGSGVRLEAEPGNGRPVVHNYGHGGAGVTLSWSSALRVARLLHRHGIEPSPVHRSRDEPDLLSHLAQTAWALDLSAAPSPE